MGGFRRSMGAREAGQRRLFGRVRFAGWPKMARPVLRGTENVAKRNMFELLSKSAAVRERV